MKTFVFGANGMIGHYLCSYLDKPIAVTRDMVNALHLRENLLLGELDALKMKEGDCVVNAIGITNKYTREYWEFFAVNSIFPRKLSDYCEKRGVKMIHISTDCVFSGMRGNYSENDEHDEELIYGMSKSLGEPINCTIIRTSVIGENTNNSLDLLEWVRSKKNTSIDGWVDHIWNGITCLQFAKICSDVINEKLFWQGVTHVHSPNVICKADLLEIINEVYELRNTIVRRNPELLCDRSLSSSRDISFNIPPIREQIIEQSKFTLK